MTSYTTEEDFIPTGDERLMSLPDTLRDVAVVYLIKVPLQVIVTDLPLGAILAGLLGLLPSPRSPTPAWRSASSNWQ